LRRNRSADETPAEPVAEVEPARPPSPADLAERNETFAMTAGVHDPDESDPVESREDPIRSAAPAGPRPDADGPVERGGWADRGTTGADRPSAASQPDSGDEVPTERGLRGLVGGGSSQVSVGAALRARDAARPTDDDLAAAETDLLIIRRGWVPREDLPPRGPRR